MKRTFSGRSWASSTIWATRGPLGVQSTRENTNSSHRSAATSSARTGASSFFEQMAFTIPRRLSVRTRPTRTGSRTTGPSLSVPCQKVSSKSQTTSLTAADSTSAEVSSSFIGNRRRNGPT